MPLKKTNPDSNSVTVNGDSLCCIILAGGQSSRFGGEDKGLLNYKGKPMVEHVIDVLLESVNWFIISCNQNEKRYKEILDKKYAEHIDSNFALQNNLKHNLPYCINDSIESMGPLTGIYSALEAIDSHNIATKFDITHVLTVCCDMPILPDDLVKQLIKTIEIEQASAVYASTPNSPHYLTHLVDFKVALESLEQCFMYEEAPSLINHKQLSAKNWLKELNAIPVKWENENAFYNINNMKQLEYAEKEIN